MSRNGARRVDREEPVPELGARVVERAAAAEPRGVDEPVEAAEALVAGTHDRAAVRRVGEVGRDEDRLAAERRELVAHRLAAPASRPQTTMPAAPTPHRPARDRGAEPLGAPGDDQHLAGQALGRERVAHAHGRPHAVDLVDATGRRSRSERQAARPMTSGARASAAVTGGVAPVADRRDERLPLAQVARARSARGRSAAAPARCVPARGAHDPGVGERVLRGRHARRAEHLDALVVAVDRLAAVVDHGQAAVGVHERDHRGVDVAGLGERRLDAQRAARVDLDDLAARHVAGHVEVVDRHVEEDPARTRARTPAAAAPGRGWRCARGAASPIVPSATASRDGLVRGVEAAVEADLERRPRPRRRRPARGRPRRGRARSASRRRPPCRRGPRRRSGRRGCRSTSRSRRRRRRLQRSSSSALAATGTPSSAAERRRPPRR